MYKDYYLKFEDEAQALSILYRMEGIVEADEEIGIEAKEGYQVANFSNISVIGTIYNDDGVYDEEGNVLIANTAKDGWHVNVRASDREPFDYLEPFVIDVGSPIRIWAG